MSFNDELERDRKKELTHVIKTTKDVDRKLHKLKVEKDFKRMNDVIEYLLEVENGRDI
jgi:hypothetical protein